MSTIFNLRNSIWFLLAFILLSVFVRIYPINAFDIAISNFTQRFHTPVLDQAMIFISSFGNVIFAFSALIISALLFFIFNYKREASFMLSIMGTGIVTFVLKLVLGRPRPTADLVDLLETYQNNSFPSGHTLSYVVFFGFLILLMRRLPSIPAYVRNTITTISYFMFVFGPISRIYLGAHWATDILGGILVGILYLQLLRKYYDRV